MARPGLIDTHVHLWDPARFDYPMLRVMPALARPFLVADYQAATAGLDVAAMVFVECFVAADRAEDEVRFAERQAAAEPRIKAIVMQADLTLGGALEPVLARMTASTPLLRGVRRPVNFEPADHLLRPEIVAAVGALARFDLSFDLSVGHHQLAHLPRFADAVGEVRLILDHCGKPDIAGGRIEPWRTHIRTLAACPNVICKLSDLPVGAGPGWTEPQLRPYVDAVVEAFGFDRLIYGGDWPVCTLATTLAEWVSLLDRCFAGVATAELDRFYRHNAIAAYRLALDANEIPAPAAARRSSEKTYASTRERLDE